MELIKLSPWTEDEAKNIDKINCVTKQIKSCISLLKKHKRPNGKEISILIQNIKIVINYWVGNAGIGNRKNVILQAAYQAFYNALYNCLLMDLKTGLFPSNVLYQGALYRYLGYGERRENTNEKVVPEYNDIFVSWTKNNKVPYIESKLYGTKTLLTCEVTGPYFGIDLASLGCGRAFEAEVVFPTIKETIVNIQYIE